MLTPKQEKHIENLQTYFSIALRNKYTEGAKEHGGAIWEMSVLALIDEAIMENIDQFTYLMTAKAKILGRSPGD